MADFTKLFKFLNVVYPPSGRGLHLPTRLTEEVALIQDTFPASYDFDQIGMELVSGSVGSQAANHSIVPAGKYRYYFGANVFMSASTVKHRLGFGISNNAGLLVHLDSSGDSGYWSSSQAVPGFADLNNVTVAGSDELSLKHPCIVPQGFNFFGFADTNFGAADPTLVVTIVVMFRERNIGEPYHSI
jgi:hypothetical protein